jgi:hypothetical protein
MSEILYRQIATFPHLAFQKFTTDGSYLLCHLPGITCTNDKYEVMLRMIAEFQQNLD